MRLSWLPFVTTFLIQVSFVSGRYEQYLWHECSGANYSSNSTYQKNRNSVLYSLSLDNDTDYGFYNISVGEGDDKVNSIALCRGDLGQTACLRCLHFSLTDLPKLCPSQKEAIVWYDNCMLRYSNLWIFDFVERPAFYMWNINNASGASWFNQGLVVGLMSSVYQASSGDSRKKFAVADTFADKDKRIYSLVQCTPDLTETECTLCLNLSINTMPPMVSEKQGGRVIGPSCNFRYEFYKFYGGHQLPYLLPPSPTGTHEVPQADQPISQHGRIQNIIVIVSSTLSFMVLFAGIGIVILLKRRKAKLRRKGRQMFLSTDAHDIKSMESLQFDFETIRVATNNFNNESKLGQGGFGAVYKGKLVEEKEIAVKRLAAHSGQGDLEFPNEVILLAKLQHRNLVRLLG